MRWEKIIGKIDGWLENNYSSDDSSPNKPAILSAYSLCLAGRNSGCWAPDHVFCTNKQIVLEWQLRNKTVHYVIGDYSSYWKDQ